VGAPRRRSRDGLDLVWSCLVKSGEIWSDLVLACGTGGGRGGDKPRANLVIPNTGWRRWRARRSCWASLGSDLAQNLVRSGSGPPSSQARNRHYVYGMLDVSYCPSWLRHSVIREILH